MIGALLILGLAAGLQSAPVSIKAGEPAMLRSWYASARCLVRADGKGAERLLSVRPQSMEFFTAFLKADTGPRCFDQRSQAKQPLHENATRGAIAEALLLRDFSALGVARGRHFATVFEPLAPSPKPMNGEARAIAFLEVAECTVEAQPEQSFQLFATEVASPAEAAVVRALVPALGTCLPQGFQVPMSAPYIRSFLAEAAYRVSVRRLSPSARTR